MAGAPPGPSMAGAPFTGTARPFHRPLGVAIISVLMIIGGVIVVLAGLAVMFLGGFLGLAFAGPFGAAIGAGIGILIMIIGAIWLAAGLGLWRMRGWAWWLAAIGVLLALVGNLGSPVGLALSALLLVYLLVVRKYFNQ